VGRATVGPQAVAARIVPSSWPRRATIPPR